MPIYIFKNTKTNKTYEEFLSMSEREQYLKDNPDDGTDPGKAMLNKLVEEQPEEEETPEEKPKGLMAKG